MKKYFVLKYLDQQRKFSFGLILLLVIFFLCGYPNAQLNPFETLPTWEVQDPMSTVFVMDKIPPTSGSLASGNSTVPNEYLVDTAIDNLLVLMQSKNIYFHKTVLHPSGIVGSDNIVVIKGNFQWTSRNTTSTDRIKGVIWKILQHPDGFTGEIIVCDNTQNYAINQEDNNSEDTEQSIVDVVNTFSSKGYPVSLRDWSNVYDVVVQEYSAGNYTEGFVYESATKISYPKFTSPYGHYNISLRYGIWDSNSSSYDLDRLCIIDFPVLKAHSWSGATIAIKNWIGVLTTAYPNERYGGTSSMHDNYFFGPYALVAKVMAVTFPKLTIVDADWTSTASNSTLTDLVHTKMLLGSTDPCAISWYAAKYILTPIAVDPNNTNPDRNGSKYKNNLSAWTNCLKDLGFAVTKDSSQISVYNFSTLPVELTSFTASISANEVNLTWQTATEVNNYGFEVERKSSTSWQKIGFVQGNGNSNSPKEYSYVDKDPIGGRKFQYRLKQIDDDGKYEYSKIVEVEVITNEYVLYQNYPNPFNPVTTVRYQLPKESKVVIRIYNILGSEVMEILNEQKEAGIYEVEFNPSDLPSGVYFYQLKAEDFIETKKTVLKK